MIGSADSFPTRIGSLVDREGATGPKPFDSPTNGYALTHLLRSIRLGAENVERCPKEVEWDFAQGQS